MYEYNLFSQQGWECPKCGSILSPSMMWCPFCSGKKEVTYSTTTTSTGQEADRKTENSSEKPNNCDDCIWSVCNYNKAFKDEPQTERGK